MASYSAKSQLNVEIYINLLGRNKKQQYLYNKKMIFMIHIH